MTTKIDNFRGQYDFLSNFHPSLLTLDGLTYPTAEHAFQALKTDDPELRCWVAQAPTPREAKLRGRQLPLTPDWEVKKTRVMATVLSAKFEQNVDLSRRLVGTGDAELEEGNWWHDQFWGNCRCQMHRLVAGKNWLGALLMELRSRLRARYRAAQLAR